MGSKRFFHIGLNRYILWHRLTGPGGGGGGGALNMYMYCRHRAEIHGKGYLYHTLSWSARTVFRVVISCYFGKKGAILVP